jgi:hypothetical protein
MIRFALVLSLFVGLVAVSPSPSVAHQKKDGIPDVTPEAEVKELVEGLKRLNGSALVTSLHLTVPVEVLTDQSQASLHSKQLRDFIDLYIALTPGARDRLRLAVREPSLGRILMSDPLRRLKEEKLPDRDRKYVEDHTSAYFGVLAEVEDDLNELLRQSTPVLLQPGLKLPPKMAEELRKLRDDQILALATNPALKDLPKRAVDADEVLKGRVRTADISSDELRDFLNGLADRNRLLETLKSAPYAKMIQELGLKQDDVAAVLQHTLQAYAHTRLTDALDAAYHANLSKRIEDDKIEIPAFLKGRPDHKDRVLAVYQRSDPTLTSADMIEIEFGEGGPSPTRLYLPISIVPEAALKAIREGKFPVVGTERYFDRLFWVRHAHWQILARKRGYAGFRMGWQPNEYRQFGPP